MPQKRLIIEIACVLLLAGLSLAAMQAPSTQHPVPEIRPTGTQIDESAKPKAETLSYIAQAGEVLIFNLPELLDGRKIDEYRIKEAPALSWLVKRSFFWRTLPKDVGKHEVLLNALVNGSAMESVVVEIEIR